MVKMSYKVRKRKHRGSWQEYEIKKRAVQKQAFGALDYQESIKRIAGNLKL